MILRDKKTRLVFHNGVLTIGGTIIEVIYEDSHIFFDFGSEYNPASEIQPETLQDLLDEQLLPYLDNMYDTTINLKGYQSKDNIFSNTAVFVSHVHLDHSKVINYLDGDIPLYTLNGTKHLLETLNINNNFLFPRHGNHEWPTRKIIGLEDNDTVEVGKISVKVMPVDHDAYGACGLVITTPDLVIAYTGDIRLHGYKKDKTIQFCEQSENCDVLIIEGVSVSFQELDEEKPLDIQSERDLIEKINDIVNTNPNKQITFNYYISNIDRVLNIIDTNQRTVVLDAYYAYVVKQVTGKQVNYFRTDDKNYNLDKELEIDLNQLLEDKGNYLWQLSENIVNIVPKLSSGGIYIHSNAIPLGMFDPNYEPFIKKFDEQNITVEIIQNSGHAYPQDLVEIINLVKPKLLIPIHSYKPERLVNKYGSATR
ncbi:MAG: MBL fold metallo-hydrolase [Epulopiscium sp. Nuni2H_MBin001]|nr:MAG: MBL fold metallo-hydrolase [Epulopiscium sp. Nuni2H_MBin001]